MDNDNFDSINEEIQSLDRDLESKARERQIAEARLLRKKKMAELSQRIAALEAEERSTMAAANAPNYNAGRVEQAVYSAGRLAISDFPMIGSQIGHIIKSHIESQVNAKFVQIPMGEFERRQVEAYVRETAAYVAARKARPWMPAHMTQGEATRAKAALQAIEMRTGIKLEPIIGFDDAA